MYRQLSQAETEILEKQGCIAENWKNIEVKIAFSAENIRNVQFAGKVKLGKLEELVLVEEGVSKLSSIQNCFIQNCTIGDNVYLAEIGTLSNYQVEDGVAIENVGILAVNGKTSFGNGYEIDVLNEGGGRELPIFEKMSAQFAYLLVMYRHNKKLVEGLKNLVSRYVDNKKSTVGNIGKNTRIIRSKTIVNVNFGSNATITGTTLLKEGSVSSNSHAPVFIGDDVIAENFIVLSDSQVHSGAVLSGTFVGQGVRIGKQFSSENSAFFANCEGFHGEACSVFAGPYTVTHHKSSLLIAGMYSFYNAGSGTNQSNHMYKLGPLHQGIVERGCKTGSFSYMLWPCRVGAFSVVMDKHSGNFDTSALPFSYITVENGKSVVTPAMNLFTVGTARDSAKWPNRDRRNDHEKLDCLSFDLLNPFTVQKIIEGSNLLKQLHENTPKSREFATHKGIYINRLMLRTSKRYYDLAIRFYFTDTFIKRIKDAEVSSLKEVRKLLAPKDTPKHQKWIDVLGLITSKNSIDNLIQLVTSEKIGSIEDLQNQLNNIQNKYEDLAYAWCVNEAKSQINFDLTTFSKQDIADLVVSWKDSSVKFKNMVLKDAEKEFDLNSRIGFGVDGDDSINEMDFESIRGTYKENKFVKGIKEEIVETEKTFEKLINQLGELSG